MDETAIEAAGQDGPTSHCSFSSFGTGKKRSIQVRWKGHKQQGKCYWQRETLKPVKLETIRQGQGALEAWPSCWHLAACAELRQEREPGLWRNCPCSTPSLFNCWLVLPAMAPCPSPRTTPHTCTHTPRSSIGIIEYVIFINGNYDSL